jgi:hypothetical protein
MIGERPVSIFHDDTTEINLDDVVTWIKEWSVIRPHVQQMITTYTQSINTPSDHVFADLIDDVDDTMRLLCRRIEQLEAQIDRRLN